MLKKTFAIALLLAVAVDARGSRDGNSRQSRNGREERNGNNKNRDQDD